MNRESWLNEAVAALRTTIWPDAPEVLVSVGWPGGRGKKDNVIGQCWPQEGKPAHVFISPTLIERNEVLTTLLHELIHAAQPVGTGHRGSFVQQARELGFTKPWTSTPATPELLEQLTALDLPQYPHTKLSPMPKVTKQGIRMVKFSCPQCGWTGRATRKWLDSGLPVCSCGTTMKEA